MDVATFQALLAPDGRRLLASLPPYDEGRALAVAAEAQRSGNPADLVAAALTQTRLRARARVKLGDVADRLYFTPDALEQATRPALSARHAARYAEAGVTRLADLCCGAVGDLLHFAAASEHVLAVDRDPVTCAVAIANLEALGLAQRVEVRCADVSELRAADLRAVQGAFVDPARRTARGRTFDPRGYSPPFSFVLELAGRMPATGAKVAPGISHHLLPPGTEAEWVSYDGTVLECALWFGPLARDAPRRATLLPAGVTVTGDGQTPAATAPVRRYLYEPDGAVIRAGLVADVALLLEATLIDPRIAYLSADRLVRTPFASAYEVTDVLPFQLKRLRALLRARRVGRLTVKKRGSAIEPEALRRQLRLAGEEAATVVLTRVGGAPTVLLVEPVDRVVSRSDGPVPPAG